MRHLFLHPKGDNLKTTVQRIAASQQFTYVPDGKQLISKLL